MCTTCTIDIFPMTQDIDHHNGNTIKQQTDVTNDLLTYPTCNKCDKKVTSNASICCTLCRHWIHQKCVGKFRKKEFKDFLLYYHNKDWFCESCNEDIFPFQKMNDEDFRIMCLENTLNEPLTSQEMKDMCTTLSDLSLINNKNKFEDLYSTGPDILENETNLDALKNSVSDSKYIFHMNELISTGECEHGKIVLNFNIRSIRKHFDRFCEEIITKETKIDFITLTETWLDATSNSKDYEIPGYHSPLIQNRDNKLGGGVMIYIHEDYKDFRVRSDLSFKDQYNNCLTIEYTNKTSKTKELLSVCYRSPSESNAISEFIKKLETVVSKFGKLKATITGDMNINIINYQQHHIETTDYYDMLTLHSFKTMITKPTRITKESATLIDHIWNNDIQNNKLKSYILVTDISDHLPCILVDSNTNTTNNKETYVQYRVLNDANRAKFVQSVKDKESILKFHVNNPHTDTQTKYKDYLSHLGTIYDESFPLKRKKQNHKDASKPWITDELQRLIKKKNKLYGKKVKSDSSSTKQKYKTCKKELEERLATAKKEYYCKKLYQDNSTLKKRWEHLLTLVKRKKSMSNYCPIDSKILGEHYCTIAEKLSSKIPKVLNNNVKYNIRQKRRLTKPEDQFHFNNLTNTEVYERLLNLDINKGAGLDNLDVKSVKSVANIISPHLCILFNLSIQHSCYPDIFKIAKCVPIYKGSPSDPYLPVNYRPISILTCINKVLEKLLHDQIYTFLEANQLYITIISVRIS